MEVVGCGKVHTSLRFLVESRSMIVFRKKNQIFEQKSKNNQSFEELNFLEKFRIFGKDEFLKENRKILNPPPPFPNFFFEQKYPYDVA